MLDAVYKMTDEIVRILGGDVFGVWLYGSAAMDDFRLGWSDIDIITLTRDTIPESRAKELLYLRQEMLKREPEDSYYRSFEGIAAGLEEYRTRAFRRAVYWGTSGRRITDRVERDAFAEFELAKYGLPVYGGRQWPFPTPGRDEIVSAVRKHYESIRKYAVTTDESLYSCGWLLDIARCVYTLRYNDVIAKTAAGVWALEEHVFPDEEPLIKTVEIRRRPLCCKDSEQLKSWLKGLGPVVQSYADVLERELERE